MVDAIVVILLLAVVISGQGRLRDVGQVPEALGDDSAAPQIEELGRRASVRSEVAEQVEMDALPHPPVCRRSVARAVRGPLLARRHGVRELGDQRSYEPAHLELRSSDHAVYPTSDPPRHAATPPRSNARWTRLRSRASWSGASGGNNGFAWRARSYPARNNAEPSAGMDGSVDDTR